MEEYNHNAKVLEKVTDYATDKDHNKVRVTIKNYEEPVLKTYEGMEMLSQLELIRVDTPENSEVEHYGETIFFPKALTKDEITAQMDYVKTNIDNYKSKS